MLLISAFFMLFVGNLVYFIEGLIKRQPELIVVNGVVSLLMFNIFIQELIKCLAKS